MFVQILRASQQQKPIMHQGSSLFVREAFTNVFTNSFQASREKFEHMEFVHNHLGVWQYLMCCIMVACPHVGTHNGDALFCRIGQVLQITDNCDFGSFSEQVDNPMVVDISDHATILMQQVQFVNAQIEQLVVWKAGLDGSSELTEESADCAFYQAGFIGDTDKGSSQCFLLNVADQAIGHEVVFIHVRYWLEEGVAASTTEKAMTLYGDPDPLPSNGQVHEQLRLSLVVMQLVMAAVGTLKRRGYQYRLEVKIMCLFIHYKNAKVRQAQEVQGHFSHCRVLPKEFYARQVKAESNEIRLRRVSCCYPTHFRDVERVCRSVKNGAIPRGIASSRF